MRALKDRLLRPSVKDMPMQDRMAFLMAELAKACEFRFGERHCVSVYRPTVSVYRLGCVVPRPLTALAS
jgi:hypothetical protein